MSTPGLFLLTALLFPIGCRAQSTSPSQPQSQKEPAQSQAASTHFTACPALLTPRTYTERGRTVLEMRTKMDVDVDGAPNAYGPRGRKTLDSLDHAHAPRESGHPERIVGYMTEYEGGPPTIQRKGDPYPGYYVSQTDFADLANPRMEDPRRYVDASHINYVVQGSVARKGKVAIGDFVTAYSCRTGRSAYAIVADSGNESGAEGSLALVQALGYDIKDGREDSVDNRDIIIRYYPGSNQDKQFFKTQAELDAKARSLNLQTGAPVNDQPLAGK